MFFLSYTKHIEELFLLLIDAIKSKIMSVEVNQLLIETIAKITNITYETLVYIYIFIILLIVYVLMMYVIEKDINAAYLKSDIMLIYFIMVVILFADICFWGNLTLDITVLLDYSINLLLNYIK